MGEGFFWRTQTRLKMYFFISIMILCNVQPSMQSSDVDCIVYNEEFMECTWTHSEGDVNSTLYHWYNKKPPQECKSYIQQHGYNVGCYFSTSEIQLFKRFYVFRNGSSGSGTISGEPQFFLLQDQVKPFAPENLVVNATKKNGLILSWVSTMPNLNCMEFEVRYRNNKDKEWQKATVMEKTNFNLASVDPEKLYTFQVKSKVNKYCGMTKLWSEWSLPVYCRRNNIQPDVNCIVYNEEFMECTWTHSEGDVNSTLYHWYRNEPPQECKSYIQQHGYNVGCYFLASEIQLFKTFYVFRNGSGTISGKPQTFQLQDQVKPFAPENLVVNAAKKNGLILSWVSTMPNLNCVEFEVRYRNNKDKEWQKVTVMEKTNFNLASVDPEKLYTFQVKSKVNIYCGTTKLWSEWSLPGYWWRNNIQTDVDCIVYNEEFMECTWTHSEGDVNYTLYHWYRNEPPQECKSYIQQHGYNVGCYFSSSEIQQFKRFYVSINGSSGSGTISGEPQKFQLQDQVKPFAPENLVVNATKKNGLNLSWVSTMPNLNCVEFEVRYRNYKDRKWQKATVMQQTDFNLVSVDPEKLYTFQVKSKINKYCGTTRLWSEWSLPLYCRRNDIQPDVDCIVYNEEFMECTWTHSEGDVNSTLYHWYNKKPPQECKSYIQQHGYNVGCYFSTSEIQLFKSFYVLRNGSSGSGDISREPQKFQLQNQVKPFAPGNLVVNATENNGLLLSWDISTLRVQCLDFEVRYRNMDREWQKATLLRQTHFNLPSVDPEKLYTFQVKSKVNFFCATAKLWSEWSLPVYWGKSNTDTPLPEIFGMFKCEMSRMK
ncbi:uncharacterized protein LOC116978891 isoform X2 [Amblyraja radiata]|uniref:uncharacterized protein LOC116978891 isoform X2 n=2 Tax=Amblyraja radiata TaxID=386614 RepID=UPI001403D444|nr:uncharacterized protein LOC116978891 isoform X2 [Amblyraja radiata]